MVKKISCVFVILAAFAVTGCATMAQEVTRRAVYSDPLSRVVDSNLALTCMGPGQWWLSGVGCLKFYQGRNNINVWGREESGQVVGYADVNQHRLGTPIMLGAAGAVLGAVTGGKKGALIGAAAGAGVGLAVNAAANRRQPQGTAGTPTGVGANSRCRRDGETARDDRGRPAVCVNGQWFVDGRINQQRSIAVTQEQEDCEECIWKITNGTQYYAEVFDGKRIQEDFVYRLKPGETKKFATPQDHYIAVILAPGQGGGINVAAMPTNPGPEGWTITDPTSGRR